MALLVNQHLLDDIITATAVVRAAVADSARLNVLSVALHGEDLVRDVLNAAFRWKLANVNAGHPNFPGIDLYDSTSGLAVQVTTTASTAKLRRTVQKFSGNVTTAPFATILGNVTRLIVFGLAKKQKSYTVTVPPAVPLVLPADAWSWEDVQRHVANSGDPAVSADTRDAFRRHMPRLFGNGSSSGGPRDVRRNELRELLNLLDRGALQAPFAMEDPVEMYASLNDLRVALQKRGAAHVASTRSRNAFRRLVHDLRASLHHARLAEPELTKAVSQWQRHNRPAHVDYTAFPSFARAEVVETLMAVRPLIDAQVAVIDADLRAQ